MARDIKFGQMNIEIRYKFAIQDLKKMMENINTLYKDGLISENCKLESQYAFTSMVLKAESKGELIESILNSDPTMKLFHNQAIAKSFLY